MSLKLDGAGLGATHRVDDRQTAIAIADDDMAAARIDADIVSIVTQIDCAERSQIRSPKHPHGAVAGIGDQDKIGPDRVADPLRLV